MHGVINRFGEFKEKELEKEFHTNEIQKGLRLSRNIILIFAITNLLFVFLDYYYLDYVDITIVLYYSFIPRIIILLAAVFVFFLIKNATNKGRAMNATVAFGIVAYFMHEFTAIYFAPVDALFEALDLIFLCYGMFLMPNRWIVNICTISLMTVVFFVLAPITIPTMGAGTKITLIIYLVSQITMMGLMFYRHNTQKRLNYLQQLQLEKLANTDILTQVFNRTACDISLKHMCENHRNFSLIMIDIDNFKQINDICGHLEGDRVIVEAAEIMKSAVRRDDMVARWGGEEFIIILPYASLDQAAETAARVKKHLSNIEYCNAVGKVTASFGVTAFVESDNMHSILDRADQLLYQAKRQGKNQVICG